MRTTYLTTVIFAALTLASSQEESPLSFLLLPVGRRTQNKLDLCLSFNSTGSLTDLLIDTDEPVTRQKLSIAVTDDTGNLLCHHKDLTDIHSKITFRPSADSTISVCLKNEVLDSSWSFIPQHRSVTVQWSERRMVSSPMPQRERDKDVKMQLQSTANLLRARVLKPMRLVGSDLKELVIAEQEKRDLNEECGDALLFSLIGFAIACTIFQTGSFFVMRKLAIDLELS
ncbi:CYFA0S08e00936g1_1 [Cyberlindnera fabianii]|uniref:CYFA0S08e00936g1_1 n=1 Tax=Cyberlindnera fabianii TaxID=36022 RepID=A0A061B2H3_CYBFA|nr:CYFA0S08e00936g1_1 [Cyberlindnera fabianii]